MSLGRKQRIDNSAWLEAVATIEEAVSRAELDELTAATVADIKATTAGKRAAYAWSAGKDSIVLGKLCEAASITDSMIGVCDLEYPAFAAWIEEHKPAGCEVINTHQDIDWLVKHQEMLFPKDSAAAGRWFSIVQHRAQREYFRAHELDVIILGRRRADGNYVGRNSNIYTDGKGVTRFSPLAAWKHEHILAYIHYHQLPLPPIYGWKNGYLCGTHPWPARQWTGSIENGWREVYDIDPGIVLVDEDGVILAGNGLYETLLSLGRTEADCYVVSGLTEAEKKKLMLADNRVFDLGVDDLAALDAFILELKDDLDIPGYEEDLLRAMVMEADEASDALLEYGTIEPEQAAAITETREKYAAREEAAAAQAEEVAPAQSGTASSTEPAKRFILCPKCGERIWL